MKEIYKSKSQVRDETAEAVEKFLRAGGSVQVIPAKKRRKRTDQRMAGKVSKGFRGGSSGFAGGYTSVKIGV